MPCTESAARIEPFMTTIDGDIPCVIGKYKFNLKGNIRSVRVSKNGMWMVVESGTDF